MSERPTLLFLHGVGDGDHDGKWRDALEASLASSGYPGLDGIEVIAPHYAHALKGWDEKVQLPPVTVKAPVREAARTHRREFERRTAALEFRLGASHERGEGWVGANPVIDSALRLEQFKQATNYLHNAQIRAQVLGLILSKLPRSGSIVIIGHSLGSVIAADLVLRLPPQLRVAGMLTVGSPLASNAFTIDKLREDLKDPPANVEWWINVWNLADLVASHRGLSAVFPWLLDLKMTSNADPKQAHAATTYLLNAKVASAVGWSLFGSTSEELARIERGLDVPVDEVERIGLLALRYAHLVKGHLTGEKLARVDGAIRQVQANEIAKLARFRREGSRPVPALVAELAFDFTDPRAAAPVPAPALRLELGDALIPLAILATENVLRPFEIVIAKESWAAALSELSAEMGLGTRLGKEVFEVVDEVRAALSGPRKVNWMKWGAIAAGAAALIVASGGLILAAAPGVAGAALVTSALASFGPGGMIGGLITAGTLVTAGGGGIAYGLASSQTSPEALAVVVERQLIVATLRANHDLAQDPALWLTLAETEVELRRTHERMDEFSDDDAPGLADLKLKITTIERALAYLSKRIMPSNDADS